MAQARYKCNTTADNEFGPAVMCNDFDFTLAFEQTVLLIGTSSLFILASLFRLRTLVKASVKVNGLLCLY
jgi:ATP-binding cassette, subfamily C (CFTR/MRP), member 1